MVVPAPESGSPPGRSKPPWSWFTPSRLDIATLADPCPDSVVRALVETQSAQLAVGMVMALHFKIFLRLLLAAGMMEKHYRGRIR